MLRLTAIAIGFYPIIAHIGLWVSSPRLVVYYLLGLLLCIVLSPPRYLQAKNIFAAILLMIGVVFLVNIELDQLLIYIPPVVIPAALLLVFLQSLGKNRVPLITQFEEKMAGTSLENERKIYTRRVTQLWVLVFALMIVEAIGLAVWASMEMWSWFTHIGNYGLIALFIIVEFIYRHFRFNLKNSNFTQFVIALLKYRWK